MIFACDAPAKLNLCLYLGPTRSDGLHELASVFESVSLCDRVTLEPGSDRSGGDAVICAGVEGVNLAASALARCREAGLLDGPPVTVTIEKRIPVAGGLGGGSADAAATLRLVAAMYDRALGEFDAIAFALGADVPSQLRPGTTLVRGAGELLVPIDPRCLAPAPRHYVIVAQSDGLSTPAVFAEADRLNLPRPDLSEPTAELIGALSEGLDFAGLCASVHNDFTPAILSLRPELEPVLATLREAGAGAAAFTGSGPTSFAVFSDQNSAEAATEQLRQSGFDACTAGPAIHEAARPRRGKDSKQRERH